MKNTTTKPGTSLILKLNLLVVIFLLGATIYSYGQVRIPFKQRTSSFTPTKKLYSVNGDFTMIGNTSLMLVNYASDSTRNNSNNDMQYVDIDNDATTMNSSSATFKMSAENGANPSCSNIIYAGLYWTGRASNSSSSPNTFSVTKNVLGTQAVNNNQTLAHNDDITYTNYTLTVSRQGGSNARYVRYTFTSSGSGNTVDFDWTNNAGATAVQVRVNGGSFSNVPVTITGPVSNLSTATLTTPYVIYSESGGIVLTLTGLVRDIRTNESAGTYQGSAKAYTNVTGDYHPLVSLTKNFDKHKISIKGPGQSSYTTFTANSNDIFYPVDSFGFMYSAYIEVTSLVKSLGVGEYTVADVATIEGNGGSTGFYGGWGIVIVYENSKMKFRDITIFDGHAYIVGNTTISHELKIKGFKTALSGHVKMKLGLMAGEGDLSIPGDYFQVQKKQSGNWYDYHHGGNATNNFFNSSIYTGGNPRNPSLGNNTGVDISIDTISNVIGGLDNQVIGNDQDSTKFRYGSTQDTYIIFCIAMGVDAYKPVPEGIISSVTPETIVYPCDEVEYKVEIRNRGTEAINNAKIVVPLPYTAINYLSSSKIVYPPASSSTSPYYDASLGANGSIVWDFGTLPLPADPNTLLAEKKFKLKVTCDCNVLRSFNCPQPDITIVGTISGKGSVTFTDVTNPFILGYSTNGVCTGDVISGPIVKNIDATDYIAQHCQNTPYSREFKYCNVNGNIPITDVLDNFPLGSQFFSEDGLTEYTINNPFPGTLGTTTYHAVPPGSQCFFVFTITVTNITSTPIVGGPAEYCKDAAAVPLTATASDPSYTLFYYDIGSNVPQLSITPSTATVGTFNYSVAEGPSSTCIGPPATIPVKINPLPSAEIGYKANPTCSGGNNNGIACVLASGGTTAYSYLWSNIGISTTICVSNLTAGISYSVTVTDAKSCTATTNVTLSLDDDTPPVITCPQDAQVSCGGSTLPAATGTATAMDVCKGGVTVDYSDENGSINCTGYASILRKWKATDAAGNTATCLQTITIIDNTPPVITCALDAQVECGDATDPSATGSATATDNCGQQPAITSSDAPGAPNCTGKNSILRTWKATDACGNTATCIQTISYVDHTAPIVTPTGSVDDNSYLGCNPKSEDIEAALGSATANDNCNGTITPVPSDKNNNSADCVHSTTRTWIATDGCGNSSSASRTISWKVDVDAPVISASGSVDNNSYLGCNPEAEDIEAALGSATANDVCDGAVTATPKDGDESTEGCVHSQTRTWTATDICGNTSSASRTISWKVDVDAPVISASGSVDNNSYLGCNPEAEDIEAALGSATANDVCDGAVTATPKDGDESTEGCVHSQTRTWTATDICGNTSSASRTISWKVDVDAPVISASGSVDNNSYLGCNPEAEDIEAALGSATANDVCDGAVTATPKDGDESTEGCVHSQTRTWTATDICGNTSSASRTISWKVDVDAPVISASGSVDNNSYLGCNPKAEDIEAALGSATANDVCDGAVTATPKDGDESTEGCVHSQTRTWTATDICGNTSSASRTISWKVDVDAPVISASGSVDNNSYLGCNPEAEDIEAALGSATANDVCDGAVTATPKDGDESTEGCVHSQTRTWTATDICGNTSSASRTISWKVDVDAPVISASGSVDNNSYLGCNPEAEDIEAALGSATANDVCDGAVTATPKDGDESTEGCVHSQTRTWTATDICGNTSSASRTISWKVDIDAPVIECPKDYILDLNSSTDPDVTGKATATDNCDLVVSISSSDKEGPINCSGKHGIIRTWTATDACNNTSTCEQLLTYGDDAPPTIKCPDDVEIVCDGSSDPGVTGYATAHDDFDGDIIPSYNDAEGDANCTGHKSIKRTWTAEDACGNTVNCVQTITYLDHTAPEIKCPVDAEVVCDGSTNPNITGKATGTDNCNQDVTITHLDKDGDANCTGYKSIIRTWEATDACGNTATCVQTIIFIDKTAPEITCSDDKTLKCYTTDIQFDEPKATDNCGGIPKIEIVSTTPHVNADGSTTYTREWSAEDGCTNKSFCSHSITVPSKLGLSLVATNATICLSPNCNGKVDLTPSGGTSPYTFIWDDVAGSTTEDVTGLCGGVTYHVTVTDQNGCPATDNVSIACLPLNCPFNIELKPSIVKCYGDKGSIELTTLDGEAPFNYSWTSSNGFTSSDKDIYGLEAGTYYVTVTDANGVPCQAEGFAEITIPDQLIIKEIIPHDVICNGGTTGSIELTVIGGTEAYSFSWERLEGGFSTADEDLAGISAGTYCVTVTDQNGCPVSDCAEVKQPGKLTTEITPSQPTCLITTGSADLSVMGGAFSSYSYYWLPGGSTSKDLSNLSIGTYCVTVTDETGCSATECTSITAPTNCGTCPTCPTAPENVPGVINTDLDSYVLFAFDELSWKGGNAAGLGNVKGGNVGLNRKDDKPDDNTFYFEVGANGAFITGSPGRYILFDVGKVGDESVVDDIHYGQKIVQSPTAIVNGTTYQDYAAPLLNIIPDANGCYNLFPGFIASGNAADDVIVPNNTTLGSLLSPLTPKVYRDFNAKDGSTVYFGDGTYTFRKWHTGTPVKIFTTPCTIIQVTGDTDPNSSDFNIGGNGSFVGSYASYLGSTNCADEAIAQFLLLTETVQFSDNSIFYGEIIAPCASTGVGRGNTFYGRIVTKSIHSDFNTDIYYRKACCSDCKLSAQSTPTNVKCYGQCTGKIDLTVTNGVDPTYHWEKTGDDFTSDEKNISGLCAGTYNVTVTDGNCTAVVSNIIVSQPDAALSTSIVPTNATICIAPNCNGKADLTPSGGTSPYTFIWDNVAASTTEDITGLCGGIIYQVTVTDQNGCPTTDNVSIACLPLNCPFHIELEPSIVKCYGDKGSIELTTLDGEAPFSYSWTSSNGFTSSDKDINGLEAGTYYVTVTDANGVPCQAEGSAVITIPDPLKVSCSSDDATGVISTSVSGGTTSYTYQWTGGATTASITPLVGGSYCVTVTDQNGCSEKSCCSSCCGNVPVFTKCPKDIDLGCNPAIIPCCDLNSVSASAGLCAVHITCKFEDKVNGCSYTRTITYTAENDCHDKSTCVQKITWKVDKTPPVFDNCPKGYDLGCNPSVIPCCDNSVTAHDNCGTATVTCSMGADIGSGCSRSRTVTYKATDACGNTTTKAVKYTWKVDKTPPVFDNCPKGYDLGCNPSFIPCCDASVTAHDNCCTPTVKCSMGTDVVNGCSRSRTITYTAKDACGNTATVAVKYTWKVDKTPPVFTSCCQGGNLGCNPTQIPGAGQAYATDNCCNPVITSTICKVIENGCGRSRTTIYTATDACGNTATCAQVYTWKVDAEAPKFSVCPEDRDLGCNPTVIPGKGQAVATDNCGTPTISCVIKTVISNGCSRSRTTVYTAKDACGNTATCVQKITWTVDTEVPVINGLTDKAIECGAEVVFDIATATDNCGEPRLVEGEATFTPDGICEITGTWTKCWTATDACGNTAELCQKIIIEYHPPVIPCSEDVDTIGYCLCPDITNPSSDCWKNPPIQGCCALSLVLPTSIGVTINGDGTITYTRVIKAIDGAGNVSNECTQTIIRRAPAKLVLTKSDCTSSNNCQTNCNGTVSVSVSGGHSPYTYKWNDVNGSTGTSISGLCGGTYCVTVTDQDGCTVSECKSVTCTPPCTLLIKACGVNCTTSSNCHDGCNGSASVSIVTAGTAPYKYIWSNGSTKSSISNLCGGTYCVTVTDKNKCKSVDCVVIKCLPKPCTLKVTAKTCNVTCNGAKNGSVTLTVTGGSAPFTYHWSPGNATSKNLYNLSGGTYKVTVTDKAGCTAYATGIVTEPTAITLKLNPTDCTGSSNCHNGCNGSISTTVTGGVTAYRYIWSNGKTTSSINGLCGGTYCVTVTDKNGCCKSGCVTIVCRPVVCTLKVTAKACNVTCNGAKDGSVALAITGGTAPFTYHWSNGAASKNISGLCGGTYCVTVTDKSGCEAKVCATVTEPTPLKITACATNCSNGGCGYICNGSASVVVSGGKAPYTYYWSNGKTTSSINNLCGGPYTLTVKDKNGCCKTTTVNIICASARLDEDGNEEATEINLNGDNMALNAYPNPFTTQAVIEFVSTVDTHGTLEVYNVIGVKVAEIYNGEIKADKQYSFNFQSADLAAGVYVFRLVTDQGIITRNMVRTK